MFKQILEYFWPEYYIDFDYISSGHRYIGRLGPYDTKSVCLNKIWHSNYDYGEGTHWMTNKDGKIIDKCLKKQLGS